MTEQAVQQRLTKVFINTQPVILTLVPRSKVKKPSGGFTWEDQPARDPQVLRLIEPGDIPAPIVTLDGVQREVTFELLGEVQAVFEAHDVFVHDGFRYEVTRIAHFNGWERRALVSKFG